MTEVKMTVNGKPASGAVEGRTLLASFLRENLSLTGTHIGCDTSQCGACVVHVNGEAVKACTMLAVEADGVRQIVEELIDARQPDHLEHRGPIVRREREEAHRCGLTARRPMPGTRPRRAISLSRYCLLCDNDFFSACLCEGFWVFCAGCFACLAMALCVD